MCDTVLREEYDILCNPVCTGYWNIVVVVVCVYRLSMLSRRVPQIVCVETTLVVVSFCVREANFCQCRSLQ